MTMTLQQFLKRTAGVPVPRLRQAIAAALTVEPARTTAEYRRFYHRVVDTLVMWGDLRTRAPAPRGTATRAAIAPRRAVSRRARSLSTARPCAARP